MARIHGHRHHHLLHLLLLIVVFFVFADAFSYYPGGPSTVVNLSPGVERGDVYGMSEWASPRQGGCS